jgi:hypothetical protein
MVSYLRKNDTFIATLSLGSLYGLTDASMELERAMF